MKGMPNGWLDLDQLCGVMYTNYARGGMESRNTLEQFDLAKQN